MRGGGKVVVSTLTLATLLGVGLPVVADAEAQSGERDGQGVAQEDEPVGEVKSTGSLVAEVSGFRNRNGQLLLAVFDSDEGFPNEVKHAIYNKAFPIEKDKVTVRVPNLAPGVYAVAIHHDEDGDFEMDTGFLGIPKEGYGASQDAPARFGPPKFRHARFTLHEGQELELPIHVRYF